MRKRIVLAGAAVLLSIVMTGCYNDPDASLRPPGDGPKNFMSGPAVGPGTLAGGSTAGPQPAKRRPAGGTGTGETAQEPAPQHKEVH